METTPKTPHIVDHLQALSDAYIALGTAIIDAAESLLPDPEQPPPAAVVLPTVDEVVDIIKEGGFYSDTARAVLGLIAERVPVWQPIEPGDIRPGMRVRYVTGDGTEGHFTVERVDDAGRFYFKKGYAWAGMSDHAWYVDPRTVPAEPEDPRVAVVEEWLARETNGSDWAPVTDLLARIDAVRAAA